MSKIKDAKAELFSKCFGDSIDIAKEFFGCRDIIHVCIYVGERLAAMASLIPIQTVDSFCGLESMADLQRTYRGFYVYGVCVSEEYRGCGLFHSIMNKAEQRALEENADFLCLIPATQSLALTYKKWGYDIDIIPFSNQKYCNKKLMLLSDDFCKFAYSENADNNHMNGQLKVLNEIFSPVDLEYEFGNCMGDV